MLPSRMGGRQPKPPQELDRLYELPNETRSLSDWYRLRHLDLPALDDIELACEANRVLSRLSYEDDRGRRAWLNERRAATEQERRHRQARRR